MDDMQYEDVCDDMRTAIGLLRELEWHHGECLLCDGGGHARTHAADCRLAAFLKETAS